MPELEIYPWNVLTLISSWIMVALIVYVASIPNKPKASHFLLGALVSNSLVGALFSINNIGINSAWWSDGTVLGVLSFIVGMVFPRYSGQLEKLLPFTSIRKGVTVHEYTKKIIYG